MGDDDVEAGFLSAMDYWFDNDFNATVRPTWNNVKDRTKSVVQDCLAFGGNASYGNCPCGTPGLSVST